MLTYSTQEDFMELQTLNLQHGPFPQYSEDDSYCQVFGQGVLYFSFEQNVFRIAVSKKREVSVQSDLNTTL